MREHEEIRNGLDLTPAEATDRAVSTAGKEPPPVLPVLSIPKGGGAIRGIGEKLTVSPRGTCSYRVPVHASACRAGASPNVNLGYDSGAGNSAFGLGWNIDVAAIARQTDRGLPRYTDEDTFLLSGAEDLVPSGPTKSAVIDGISCVVQRFRPRTETAFTRVERYTPVSGGGPAFWRTISRENVTAFFRTTIADPQDPRRVFQWLLDETRDDRGNVMRYHYSAEDLSGVDTTAAWERHRNGKPQAQRYLSGISYGNVTPGGDDFKFRLTFEYEVRTDPFSTYRPGFEVRTWRVCKKVLMYHDFPAEVLGPGPLPRLVFSTDLTHDGDPAALRLTAVGQTGYVWDVAANDYQKTSLPPLEFEYTRSAPEGKVRVADPDSAANLPAGVDSDRYHWVDLDGEGLAGALTAQGEGWFYKRNLGGGRLGALEHVPLRPAIAADGQSIVLDDIGGDGSRAIVRHGPVLNGFQERDSDGRWAPFTPFTNLAMLDHADPAARRIDVDGDGLADVLITAAGEFRWHRSLGREGFGPQQRAAQPWAEDDGPVVGGAAEMPMAQTVVLADMSGDGLTDLVRIRSGEICYWPNLGHGRFGAKVVMGAAPVFDHFGAFDPTRVRIADVDGTGPADVLYLGRDGVSYWINRSGNSFGPQQYLAAVPDTDRLETVEVIDLLGSGTSCLVWSSPKQAQAGAPLRYLDLSRAVSDWLPETDADRAGHKPGLLCQVRTNLGAMTRLAYTPSTRFYLEDRAAGRPWQTRLHFPVQVVARTVTTDQVAASEMVSAYRYRHGHFDGPEREFRGFGMVEQSDAETLTGTSVLHRPPVRTRSWYHVGAPGSYEADYYAGDPKALKLGVDELPAGMSAIERRQAIRALNGSLLRTEVYADDGTELDKHPYSVVAHRYRAVMIQPAAGERPAVFRSHPLETITHHYERNPADPRVSRDVTLEVDDFNTVRRQASVGYPRRMPELPEQAKTLILLTVNDFAHADLPDALRVAVPVQTKAFEVTGVAPEEVPAKLAGLTEIPYEQAPPVDQARMRLVQWRRTRYWDDTLTAPLPFGQPGPRALPYEEYRLAFTPGLLSQVYGVKVTPAMLAEGGHVLDDGVWWAPSGVRVYDPAGFYLPRKLTSPFGNESGVEYDAYKLLPVRAYASAAAPLDSLVTTAVHDYRVLSAREVTEPNGNRARVNYDALGRVVAVWAMGRDGTGEGDPDNLPGTVFVYELGTVPVSVRTEVRERHGAADSPWQRSRIFSDGSGRAVMTKTQAEPGLAWTLDGGGNPVQVDTGTQPRWVGTGRTVFDNKGKPVKQYEPYFSVNDGYEAEPSLVMQGVTPVMHYDPVGRLTKTEHADGTVARVAIGAWRTETWDQGDAVLESLWYAERGSPSKNDPEPSDKDIRAAWLSTQHAATPAVSLMDSQGRPVRAIEDGGPLGPCETISELDIEGNTRSVTDPRGILSHRQDIDLSGRIIRSVSADAGQRWILPDIAGTPIRVWDNRPVALTYRYDAIRRPIARLAGDTVTFLQFYGEGHPEAVDRNLLGRAYLTFDGAGVIKALRYDFKGNLTSTRRNLAVTFLSNPDWTSLLAATVTTAEPMSAPLVEPNPYQSSTTYDAINRIVLHVQPDGSVITPVYSESGRLATIAVRLPGEVADTAYVTGLHYDAKGQRQSISYGNGTRTDYTYDPRSFRLTRLVTLRGANEKLQDLGYTYDAAGNIAEIRDDAQQTVFFAGQQVAPVARYRYDALHRLTRANGREHASLGNQPDSAEPSFAPLPHPNDANALRNYTEIYAYDKAGNLTSQQHQAGGTGSWTRAYTIASDSNRLMSHSTSAGPASFGYDANGNMTAMAHLPGPLDWDDGDHLSRADLGGGGRAYYRYDGTGRRVRKILVRVGGLIEEHVYLDGYEEYRRRQGGNVSFKRATLHVMDDTRRIALIETETVPTVQTRVRYQLSNQLGSSTLELSATAEVVSYEEYHPYGTTALWLGAAGAEASDRRYRYNGKEKDEETALYHYGARYYACWLGRWTSCDPAGLTDGPNRYSYVRGNPVSHIDPDGRALKQVQVGGLTISPNSQVSAQQWVDMINRNTKMPQWMKDCFAVSGNKIVLNLWMDTANPTQPPGPLMPPGTTMPPWFETTLVAIKEKEWHLTTGVSIVNEPSSSANNKLFGDHEPGDDPKLNAAKASSGTVIGGETIPAESKKATSVFGRQMLDSRAGGGPTGKGGLRRGPSGGTPGEGLIIVANRFRDTLAPGIEVLRNDDAMLSTFFHELGSHGGLITQLRMAESDHTSPDATIGLVPMSTADVNAEAVRLFFGASDAAAIDTAETLGPTGLAKLQKVLKELDAAVKELEKALKQLEQMRQGKGQKQPAKR